MAPSQLKETLKNMNFFIFPSTHSGEGQSNSLIEAMCAGLIPIASDNGFSKDVLGNCGKIITDRVNPNEYKEAIEYFVDNNQMEVESRRCMKHIHDCHNLNNEIKKVVNFYNTL